MVKQNMLWLSMTATKSIPMGKCISRFSANHRSRSELLDQYGNCRMRSERQRNVCKRRIYDSIPFYMENKILPLHLEIFSPRDFSTMNFGRFLTSSYMRDTYAPIIPNAKNNMPNSNKIVTNIVATPVTDSHQPNNLAHIINAAPNMDKVEKVNPNTVIMFSRKSENATMPLNPILKLPVMRLYFPFPSILESRLNGNK